MPIDPKKALGHEFPESETSWTQDQVILYQLGVGAGVPPTDPHELEYTYEKNLKVLPSFGVIPVFGALGGIGNVPGLQFNFAMLLHGEQDIELHQPIPTAAKIRSRGRVAGIYDKGKAALVILEYETSDEEGPLFTTRMSAFIRGEGGFGGPSGPKPGNAAPERDPDGVSRPRRFRSRPCSTASTATRTRSTPTPSSPRWRASTCRSSTASARTGSPARRSSTRPSAATPPAWRATRRASAASPSRARPI